MLNQLQVNWVDSGQTLTDSGEMLKDSGKPKMIVQTLVQQVHMLIM